MSKKKKSFISRPYQTWINFIYMLMYYGKKITILPEFSPSEKVTQGYVAGMDKLGYIQVDVIDGNQNYKKSFDSYMLD